MKLGWIWEILYGVLRSTLAQPTILTSIVVGKGLAEDRHFPFVKFPLHLSRSPMQTNFFVLSLQVSWVYANLCAHAIILKYNKLFVYWLPQKIVPKKGLSKLDNGFS